jgi:hypothetical protein
MPEFNNALSVPFALDKDPNGEDEGGWMKGPGVFLFNV